MCQLIVKTSCVLYSEKLVSKTTKRLSLINHFYNGDKLVQYIVNVVLPLFDILVIFSFVFRINLYNC